MKVEAILSFQGDFGPGTPVVSYDVGDPIEVPERIAQKWISRGLVRLAPETTKTAAGRKTHTEASDNGE